MDSSDWMDRTSISRHAVLNKDGEYDDGGYCDTKVPYGGSMYWAGVADGNGERMCAECMLATLLQQLRVTGTMPTYDDCWTTKWKEYHKEVYGNPA